jgi:L-asparaginase
MNGETKKFSGVMNVESIQQPIKLAELLQNENDRVLGGEGANLYALKQGPLLN